jgi:threonyl-tRNA synthetase
MKILSLHCDYIKFKPVKPALKGAELTKEEEKEVNVVEPLVIFTAIEKQDESNKEILKDYIENILDLLNKTKAKKTVLYPYAHLSPNLSDPDFAKNIMIEAEKELKKKKIEVFRAPFGFYKEFELKCKGHPLAELSRSIGQIKDEGVSGKGEASKSMNSPVINKEDTSDPKKLLAEISKSKLNKEKLKDNDHRILGQQMDLFSFSEVAPGMIFWHDKGLIIYNELINFWREEHRKAGYQEIKTPQIMDSKLWKVSGHWDKYKENNFITSYEGRPFLIKPMNCPGGMLVYKNSPKSYKEFPIRAGELGTVHRTELSGVLAGAFRLVQFTQDDAHIFCTNETQIEEEIISLIKLINYFYKKLGISFDHVELSTRPEKRIGTEEAWDMAEDILETVLKKSKTNYKINKGDGAFYGPKIDFHVKDSLGRTWQLSTIQLDFALPERFELEYTDKEGNKKRPIMLHRVIYGAIERFIAILLEHTNGRLPTWLAPVQIKILSFTDRNEKSARKLFEELREAGIRCELDVKNGPVQGRVRDAEVQKIPYIIMIGDKEEQNKTLAIRKDGKVKFGIKKDEFFKEILEEIKERK